MERNNQSLQSHASLSSSPICKTVLTNQARGTCVSACLDTGSDGNPSILRVLLGDFYQHLSTVVNGLVGVHRKLTDTEETLKQKKFTFGQLGMQL